MYIIIRCERSTFPAVKARRHVCCLQTLLCGDIHKMRIITKNSHQCGWRYIWNVCNQWQSCVFVWQQCEHQYLSCGYNVRRHVWRLPCGDIQLIAALRLASAHHPFSEQPNNKGADPANTKYTKCHPLKIWNTASCSAEASSILGPLQNDQIMQMQNMHKNTEVQKIHANAHHLRRAA